MIRRAWLAAVVLGVWLAPAPAFAQLPGAVWGGAVVMAPLSDTADRFGLGYGFNIGASWRLLPMVGLRVDYVRSGIDPKAEAISVVPGSRIDVSSHIQFGSAAAVIEAPTGVVRVYIVAGAGIYRRDVSVSGVPGGTAVCDPWLLVCGADANGSRSTTDFGLNVGAGILIGPAFVEGRYHLMWGPEFTTPGGTVMATGKFFPVTVGVRF